MIQQLKNAFTILQKKMKRNKPLYKKEYKTLKKQLNNLIDTSFERIEDAKKENNELLLVQYTNVLNQLMRGIILFDYEIYQLDNINKRNSTL